MFDTALVKKNFILDQTLSKPWNMAKHLYVWYYLSHDEYLKFQLKKKSLLTNKEVKKTDMVRLTTK